MAFVRPLLPILVERIQQDFISRLEIEAPILRRSMVGVLARVLAGAAHMLHGHLEFLSKQVFPDQAEEEYLLRWGALFGLARNPASYATGSVAFTGSNGSVIPAHTVVRRVDGWEYETNADGTISAGTATVVVTAKRAGEDGNCDAGTEVSCESPIAGVDSVATVASGNLSNGADQETIEAFRTRVIERMQFPPHGGAKADYIAWAKQVPGVTRAWCFPLEDGPGTVTVRFVRDDDDGGIIPDSTEIAAVQTHITGTGPDYLDRLAPVTALATVKELAAVPLNFVLSVSPNTVEVQSAVRTALADLIRRIASPGGTIPLSQIEVAIGTADGVSDFNLVSPSANVTHDVDEIATLGDFVFG